MFKLLLINVAKNWGSTGKIVDGIGNLAISQGWDVYIAHGARYKNSSTLKAFQLTSWVGEILHFIKSSFLDAQGLGSRFSTKRFLRILDTLQPDIVHIHNIHGCFLNYPLLFTYLKTHNIPVIWTLHDCWPITGHCVHFNRTQCSKWQSMCMQCPQTRDFPSSYFLDMSRRNFILKRSLFSSMEKMRITTVSSWLKSIISHSFLSKFPTTVVPNGVNTELFKPMDLGVRNTLGINDKIMLLGVATGFGKRKGIDDYIELATRLSPRFQLVLVGVSKSDRQKLPNSIIAIDRANGTAELSAYYTAADVLLSLSYEETFGLTIIEAMSCGTPVVVYNNTAQPELVTQETGMVVPTGDISEVERAISVIIKKGKAYYSKVCRERAKLYDEKDCYQKYINLYTQSLQMTI